MSAKSVHTKRTHKVYTKSIQSPHSQRDWRAEEDIWGKKKTISDGANTHTEDIATL